MRCYEFTMRVWRVWRVCVGVGLGAMREVLILR